METKTFRVNTLELILHTIDIINYGKKHFIWQDKDDYPKY